jgi:predicted HicB family RNase H-like nuclease
MAVDPKDFPPSPRRGRPIGYRAEVELSPVSTRVPSRLHDKIASLASERGMSVSGFVRQVLILRLRDF